MGRYHPSHLILRRRPRRIKGKLDIQQWFMALRREHELRDLRRDLDYLQRSCMSDFYMHSTHGVYITDLQRLYRELDLQMKLNHEQIEGLKAREVPGFGIKEKTMAFQQTNDNAEDIHTLQDEQRIQAAQINRLRERVSEVERAVGEAPDV